MPPKQKANKKELFTDNQTDVLAEFFGIATSLKLSQTLYSCTIRILRRAHETKKGDSQKELIDIAEYLVNFLLRSKPFANTIKLYAQLHEAEALPNNIFFKFSLIEWAHIISLFVLSRRMHITCKSPDIRPNFHNTYASYEIGKHLSLAIPTIAPWEWMLVSALRPLSLVLFALKDEATLVEHRRRLRELKRSPYDADLERKLFGINHPALCGLLAQKLGLGITISADIHDALDLRIPNSVLTKGALRLRYASVWVDSLTTHNAFPSRSLPSRLSPSVKEQAKLITLAKIVTSEGVPSCWLNPRSIEIAAPLDEQQIMGLTTADEHILRAIQAETEEPPFNQ